MALTLVTLDTKASAKAAVVEMARSILAQAEAGELLDLSFSASVLGGTVKTGFTATDDQLLRLASVTRLLHRLQIKMDESVDG